MRQFIIVLAHSDFVLRQFVNFAAREDTNLSEGIASDPSNLSI